MLSVRRRVYTVLLSTLTGLLLAVPGWAVLDEPACRSTVRFELEPKGPVSEELRGEIVLRPVEAEGEPLTLEARVGSPVAAKLPCSSEWEATAVFPETWSPRTRVMAGASGETVTRGVSEGVAHAMATFSSGAGRWASELVSLLLREGEDVGPLELRMRKNQQLSGTVQSSLGPVPGAGILVVSLHPTAMGTESARTDVDGSFTAKVPASAGNAAVIVSPPGYALKAFTVPVDGTPQTLTVSREGGELEILVPHKSEEIEEIEKEGVILLAFQNGLPLPMPILNRWALGHGRDLATIPGTLAVPEVAPGEYRACLAAQSALAAWQASGWTAPLARCTSGQLTAGGTLQLDLSSD